MLELLNILITVIIPILCVAGLGALIDRTRGIETRTISQLVIYLAAPALSFFGIATSSINVTELWQLLLFSITFTLVMTGVAWGVARLFRFDRLTTSAFILAIVLINMVNYGYPVNEFAFGKPGLERAILMGAMGAVYANTLGIFLASSGKASIGGSLLNVIKVPVPYAVILGLIVNLWDITLPTVVLRVTELMGRAAVPLMLIVLGIQISRTSWHGRWPIIAGASVLRLVGGTAIAIFIAWGVGLKDVTYQVAIIESAMPTAVFAGILATEFNSDAELVSSIIFASTLLSLITVPIVLWILI